MSHDPLNRHSEDEDVWYAELRNVLESTYLTIDDPREQSRFSGDQARWERGRRPIAEAINCDVSLLLLGLVRLLHP